MSEMEAMISEKKDLLAGSSSSSNSARRRGESEQGKE